MGIKSGVRKDFLLENVSLHSLFHSNFFLFFRAAKKRKVLLLAQERKQDKAERQLDSCWTSLALVGIFISMTD